MINTAAVISKGGTTDWVHWQTGARLWSYSSGSTLQTSPVVANGMLYIGTGDGGVAAFGLR